MAARVGAREREVELQTDLLYHLKRFLETPFNSGSITLVDVAQEHPVGDGRADLVVFDARRKPFLVIEAKRKEGAKQDIDPLSPKVIKQAYTNAGFLGAPYFATVNRGYIAVFQVPDRGQSFDIGKHRVFLSTIKAVNAEFVQELLDKVTTFESAPASEKENVATQIDWAFIIRLRSFVDWLFRRIAQGLPERLQDKAFAARVAKLSQEGGINIEPAQLAREMAYILMNKIIFYKGLERAYKDLPRLNLVGTETMVELVNDLQHAWQKATIVTKDFEAIFTARIYDELPFTDKHYDLLDIKDGLQGFIEDMERYHLEHLEADVIGHVYEDLIPPEEKHALGQVYTPPSFAEFLAQWAVRGPDDVVLDPASGSGTFLVKAYQQLSQLKVTKGLRTSRGIRHREILSQLYGVDINPFPAQLTAMNLAMRDLLHPISEMNILERDFFKVSPGQEALVPYKVRMPTGEEARSIKVPFFDAILANPPYTRWSELTDDTKQAVNGRLGTHLEKYQLRAQPRKGIETALYQHFVLSAADFLKEKGRCAVLISNSWLSNDVGVRFGQFLLDHFKVIAVIDLGPRIFPLPIVAANLLLLERCSDAEQRNANQAVFAFIDRPLDIREYHNLVKDSARAPKDLLVRSVPQSEIPRDRKWIDVLYRNADLDKRLLKATTAFSKVFDATRGTIQYCAEHNRGLGANPFFFLTEERVQQFQLPSNVLRPTIPGPRDLVDFTFSEADWERLKAAGKDVYAFAVRLHRNELPAPVKEYVRWGETKCRNREGDVCSESGSCKERAGKADYKGWYDFGEVREAAIAVPRHNAYRPRFVDLKVPGLAINESIECLRPLQALTENQRQALLAFLNSSVVHLHLELAARPTGGGALDVDPQHLRSLAILDVANLKQTHVLALAKTFRELDREARKIGGANTHDNLQKLAPAFEAIDDAVASVMGISKADMEEVRRVAKALLERRTQRSPDPQPEFMKGGAAAVLKAAPKAKKEKAEPAGPTLLDYNAA